MERGSFQRAAPVFHLIGSLKNSHEALERNITRYGIQQTNAKFYILWSSPGIASAVVSALIAYTTFYATDVLQLNAGLVGTLLLVSKLFDGVTDLVAVFLVDRTNTKLGRARPYDITYALFALFTLFLFNTPRMGKTLMAVYVFVMYTLIFSVFQTLYSCASTVYLSRVIETDENRVKVNSISSVISTVIAIIVGIALPLLIEAVGTSHEKWGQMAIYICAPCVVLALVRLFTIKEKQKLSTMFSLFGAKVGVESVVAYRTIE